MIEPRETVLIGDKEQARVDVLRDILLHEFNREAVVEGNFNALKAKAHEAAQSFFSWRMVLLADDLPISANGRDIIQPGHFEGLNWIDPGIRLGCIFSAEERPDFEHVNNLFFLPVPLRAPTREERNEIVSILESGGRLEPALRAPIVHLPLDPILRRQIRALHNDRVQEKGKTILGNLIARCLDCDTVEVMALNQGKSGAPIFRVRHGEGAAEKEFVLKLCDNRNGEDVKKITSEIEGYQKAQICFPNEEYAPHIPKLKLPKRSDLPNDPVWRHIVTEGNWYAIRYDFLGGNRFGKFIDLETALLAGDIELLDRTWKTDEGKETAIANEVLDKIKSRPIPPSEVKSVKAREMRIHILRTVLNWLCQHLYLRNEQSPTPGIRLWNFDDGLHKKYATRPPYSLSRKTKEKILSFLESREADLGERFFDSDWERVRGKVYDFIELNTKPKRLDRPVRTLMSPAHGDLNANNVLLWLNESRTFLIDFPFFQAQGHALQDLAQLEVEIEFILMDRQADSPLGKLAAYDYTYSQMPLWRKLEDHLLREKYWKDEVSSWPQPEYQENIKLCLEMIQMVRHCAIRLKEPDWQVKPEEFFDEYFTALFYHTVRAIGYESLSVFKRLLAIYSSGKLIERMSS